VLALLTLLFAAEGAHAESPPAPSVSGEESPLDSALEIYLDGDLAEARDALLRIVNDPELEDEALLQEARIWLGEVQYFLGEKEAARSTFRTVLLVRRGYRMDPFVHPPEVVAFFDSVRAEVDTVGPGPGPVPRSTPPIHAFLWPGGLQLHNGRPGAAALTAATVTGSAAAVGGLRFFIVRQDVDPDTFGVQIYEGDDDRLRQVKQARAAQFGVSAVAATLWISTTVGGTSRAIRPTMTPGGLGLSIRW